MVTELAIECHDVCAWYGTREVLHGVNWTVPRGSLVAVLGPNGSGKSTFLRVLAGMHPKWSGQVRVEGREVGRMSVRERARWLAYLPQTHRVRFPFTVREVVLSGRTGRFRWRPSSRDWELVDQVLSQTGLHELADRSYTDLSGGEQQRVLIARLLAQQAPVLLLDEPTAHLDLHRQCQFMAMLQDWCRRGHTVVVVVHDPNLAFAWADDWLALRDGVPYCSGEPLWAHNALRGLYPAELRHLPMGERAAVVPSDSLAPWGRPKCLGNP